MFSTITSKLGRHVDTTNHDTQAEAEKAAECAIETGTADSAAVWTESDDEYGNKAVAYFGTGR